MSITVQVQLGWFECAVINSVKYQVPETNTVSPGLFLVLLWLWYSSTAHCKFSGASLYKAVAWWVQVQSVQPVDGLSQALCAGRGQICGGDSGWSNSEGLCLQNPCRERYMLFHGVVSGLTPIPSPCAWCDKGLGLSFSLKKHESQSCSSGWAESSHL